jgi:hypothetical protein
LRNRFSATSWLGRYTENPQCVLVWKWKMRKKHIRLDNSIWCYIWKIQYTTYIFSMFRFYFPLTCMQLNFLQILIFTVLCMIAYSSGQKWGDFFHLYIHSENLFPFLDKKAYHTSVSWITKKSQLFNARVYWNWFTHWSTTWQGFFFVEFNKWITRFRDSYLI